MEQTTRRVAAPRPTDCRQVQPILSVEAEPGEDVEWIWTHYPDGRSAVTGYRLVSASQEGAAPPK